MTIHIWNQYFIRTRISLLFQTNRLFLIYILRFQKELIRIPIFHHQVFCLLVNDGNVIQNMHILVFQRFFSVFRHGNKQDKSTGEEMTDSSRKCIPQIEQLFLLASTKFKAQNSVSHWSQRKRKCRPRPSIGYNTRGKHAEHLFPLAATGKICTLNPNFLLVDSVGSASF